MKLKSLEFFDYKSFPRFKISARDKNVLVGPNNAGKSTSLDALRIAFDVLRSARRRSSQLRSQDGHGVCATYFVPQSVVQLDLRYCVHNFKEVTAKIELTATNGNKFVIKLNPDADLECYLVSDTPAQKGSQYLKSQFPLDIVVVPTLSPLEQNEEVVRFETVERNRFGRLASRNFRNFWLHKTDKEFEAFSDLVEHGWPGIRLMPPEIQRDGKRSFVQMYFRDGSNVREVQWAGFGFQVWMQTMMHLTQSDHRSILVLDEPDIYLHPDLQHRLLQLVGQRVGQFFIATHSTEIINASDAADVLIVRPSAQSAKRLRNENGYSEVYSAIGSSENAQFARLARTQKVLYFEGADNRLLSKVSKALGGIDYLSGSSVTLMKTDGFSNWGKVSTTAWVFREFFDMEVQVAALFDSDYRSLEEVDEFEKKMAEAGACCFVLPFKEIENVLLVPRAMNAVIQKYSDGIDQSESSTAVEAEFERLIGEARDKVFGLRMGHYIQYQLSKNPKLDTPTLSSTFQAQFTEDWSNTDFRTAVVPGKVIFSAMGKFVQENFGVTLTTSRVADELTAAEIHPKLIKVLADFRSYFS
ncbi:ATP-dependent nuclease [Celeribacter sp. SCSIO 80788]|uniref:ATP-dependent nuclease n=1 Tax=Celeribacter sp. SCSIO 80788 TaxID=3117013 RepID=UPI003DA54840